MRKGMSLVCPVVCLTVILCFNSLAFAGDINPPPGPVSPTMKTLVEIEPRVADDATSANANGGMFDLEMVIVPGSDLQPNGPTYDFNIGRFEITIAQFVSFLNDAEVNTSNARGAFMSFVELGEAAGDVKLGATEVLMFDISATTLASDPEGGVTSVTYDLVAPLGSRYSFDPSGEDHPISGATWYGAVKFCNWMTIDQGVGEEQRCYTEGPDPMTHWHPVTISDLGWASGADLTFSEREALVTSFRGFRLPMDHPTTAGPFREAYKAAAWNEAASVNHMFGFGRDEVDALDANFFGNGDPFDNGSSPIGYFDGINANTRANANSYSVFDLSGNLAEWTQDRAGPGLLPGVLRGGSFLSPSAGLSSDSYIIGVNPWDSDPAWGFRVVQVVGLCEQPLLFPQLNTTATCAAQFVRDVSELLQGTPPLIWSFDSAPEGMEIDALNGTILWDNPIPDGSPYTITVRAENNCAVDLDSWLLSVERFTPEIIPLADATVTKQDPYIGPTPELTTPSCMSPVTWNLLLGPPGMTIETQTGVVTWSMADDLDSPYTIIMRATNEQGFDEVSWQLTVEQPDWDRPAKLFYASKGLWRVNLNGSVRERLLPSPFGPSSGGIDVDQINAKVYFIFTNSGLGLGIRRMNYDGSEVETIIPSGSGNISVAPLLGKLYWTYGPRIRRANLNGSAIEDVTPPVPGGIDASISIDIDEANAKLYFCGGCGSNDFEAVYRANLDGTHPEMLFDSMCPASQIEVNPQSGFFFWTDFCCLGTAQPGGLKRSPIGPLERRNILPRKPGGDIAIDMLRQQIYMAFPNGDFNANIQILRFSFDGSNVTPIVTGLRANRVDPGVGAMAINPFGPRFADLTVTMNNPDAGSPTPEPGRHTFDISQTVQILANPALGYRFDAWSSDVADTSAENTTVQMDRDQTVIASYVKVWELVVTAVPDDGGTVSPVGLSIHDDGTIADLIAGVHDGFRFVEWSGGPVLDPTSAASTITMNANYSLEAIFAEVARGDFDADGDIDLTDAELFILCLDGPDDAFPFADCEAFDFDSDGDVDFDDFSRFASAFTGE